MAEYLQPACTSDAAVLERPRGRSRQHLVPVKWTFLHYEIQQPGARRRARTCPCSMVRTSLEHLELELCHAMAPLSSVRRTTSRVSSQASTPATPAPTSGTVSRATTCSQPAPIEVNDCMSEASTAISEKPTQEVVQRWTSVSLRRKQKTLPPTPSTAAPSPSPPPSKARGGGRSGSSGSSGGSSSAWRQRREASFHLAASGAEASSSGSGGWTGAGVDYPDTPSSAHGGKGHGKERGERGGLQHFQKVEVGIEDDPRFRVVQRLIGPKGKHMRDIQGQARGSKIWIIGRGSRSWEDDQGPLVVCVGAQQSHVYQTALSLVQALLERVREDYKNHLQRRAASEEQAVPCC